MRVPPPPPRRFRFGAVNPATIFMIGFAALVALVGWGGIVIVGRSYRDDSLLDERGRKTKAIATVDRRSRGMRGDRPLYRIDYAFEDSTGARWHRHTKTPEKELLDRARGPEPIEVVYDPADPTLSRINGERMVTRSILSFSFFVDLVFAVTGTTLVLLGLQDTWRVRAIYVRGQAVLATVTAVTPLSIRINKSRLVRISYTFDTLSGPVSGQTKAISRPAVGSTIWVIHDVANPRKNITR